MFITQLVLKNWRNFRSVDVALRDRAFLVGPNACGKSNFLDVFRFLRDIAKRGGGFQSAVHDRGGVSKIRCLAARQEPDVEIEISLAETPDAEVVWKYAIGFHQQTSGKRLPLLRYEKIWQRSKLIVDRPNEDDKKDLLRLTQTHLEQISANESFRDVADFLDKVLYLHLVPQLLKNPDAFSGPGIPGDPFGKNFLERVARAPEKTRKSRLKKIETVLRKAAPQLRQLCDVKDESGFPHLEAIYEHWRPKGAKQREDQFSDGTLRLIALFWSLLEGDSLLLLEEPELSLNAAIVRLLPAIFYRLQKKKNRQIMLSTHSVDLLSDEGIEAEQVLLLIPESEGTRIQVASERQDVKGLLESGFTIAEAVMPIAKPNFQGMLFEI
ncbi:MAG TPA: AAA family ATPase [Anaerohalosphaeraceae bacterium]|nr:AAA family ATPase [Anaerohalosphaeraceae bacterium]